MGVLVLGCDTFEVGHAWAMRLIICPCFALGVVLKCVGLNIPQLGLTRLIKREMKKETLNLKRSFGYANLTLAPCCSDCTSSFDSELIHTHVPLPFRTLLAILRNPRGWRISSWLVSVDLKISRFSWGMKSNYSGAKCLLGVRGAKDFVANGRVGQGVGIGLMGPLNF